MSKKVFVFNKGSWVLDPMEAVFKKGRWVFDPMEVNKARREVWIRLRLAYLDKLIKQFDWKK